MKRSAIFLILAGTAMAYTTLSDYPQSAATFIGDSAVSVSASSPENTIENQDKVDQKAPRYFRFERKTTLTSLSMQNSPASTGAAADFDSDGTKDLVLALSDGGIQISRGNEASIYPNSPEAARSRKGGGLETHPFREQLSSKAIGFVPDRVFAGDFNADGKADVVAAQTGADRFAVMLGDGRGNLADPALYELGGSMTAIASGEIGRPDGQADLIISVATSSGPRLVVFEHPEGAFKSPPEIITLDAPVSDMAIGHLDTDAYADVAMASGESVMIYHGRGQAYPLDRSKEREIDIQRPSAMLQSRKIGTPIAAIQVGRFIDEPRDSIAVLTRDGSVLTLERPGEKPSAEIRSVLTRAKRRLATTSFRPVDDVSEKPFSFIKESDPKTEEEADRLGVLMVDSSERDRQKILDANAEKVRAREAKLTPQERSLKAARETAASAERRQRRKEGIERGLSAKPVSLAAFRVNEVTKLAGDLSSVASGQFIKARISGSGNEDLIVIEPGSVSFIGRIKEPSRGYAAEIVTEKMKVDQVSAIIPMRLNSDGLSDLVLIGTTQEPAVLMSSPAQVYVVNSTDDAGGDCMTGLAPCTLRRAMFLANQSSDYDYIVFDLPPAGAQTIHLQSELPRITTPMLIDATTQPGYIGSPIVELDGSGASGNLNGFSVEASNSVFRGFIINRMKATVTDNGVMIAGNGIAIYSTNFHRNVGGNFVEGNWFGIDASGNVDLGNHATGVNIYDADFNTIGGTVPSARNVMSGNGNPEETGLQGAGLALTAADLNSIKGNFIGTNASGNASVGNSYGSFFSGILNDFGGDEVGAGNVVSGNGSAPNSFGDCAGRGVMVVSVYTLEFTAGLTNNNNFKGNLIGTDVTGTQAVGNCQTGITSEGNINTFIGSITPGGRNTISANGWDAVWCGFAESLQFPFSGACSVSGNNIGTDITGMNILGNDQRNNTCVGFCISSDTVWFPTNDNDLAIAGGPGGTSEAECTGFCNVISGNYAQTLGGGGIEKVGNGFGFIVNNYLGVNRTGTAALPNFNAFGHFSGGFVFGGTSDDGNGGTVSNRNIVSGNHAQGAYVQPRLPGEFYAIRGNYFGTSSDGLSAIPNGIGGSSSSALSVYAEGGTLLSIGGSEIADRNIFAATLSDSFFGGTQGHGINITAVGGGVDVFNNYIGMNAAGDPLGNRGSGIVVRGEGNINIGGVVSGNAISYNGGAGVLFTYGSNPDVFTSVTTSIRGNSIYNNGGLAIDLAQILSGPAVGDGVTPNDCGDADGGPNKLQNFPELFEPLTDGTGQTVVPGTLKSLPASPFLIDFYSNASVDPTNYGEGQIHIGTQLATTDGNGFAAFVFPLPAVVPAGSKITATATDEYGRTSEFSCAAGLCTQMGFEQAVQMTLDSAAAGEGVCLIAIVVNTTGDQPDQNPADGSCDVDTSNSGLQCTLRAAIQEANARPGSDIITFDIPGSGVQTINLTSILPPITGTVSINGNTQSGFVNTPMIEVNGVSLPAQSDGLTLAGPGVKVRNLALNYFGGSAIAITGNGAQVIGCHFGVSPDGMSISGGGTNGVFINNSSASTIGDAAGKNLFGLVSFGVRIQGASAFNNKILANNFNTAIDNTTTLNPSLAAGSGVYIGNGAHDNQVGSSPFTEQTVSIFKTGNYGVLITEGAYNNKVVGGLFGTLFPTSDGDPIPSFCGVCIVRARNNTIGGSVNSRNVFGSHYDAVYMSDVDYTPLQLHQADPQALQRRAPRRSSRSAPRPTAAPAGVTTGNILQGSFIGLGTGGNQIPNRRGVTLLLADSNTIGGELPAQRNYISNNLDAGIDIEESNNNTILKNYIGTNSAGDQPAPNAAGIFMMGSSNIISGNLISGNLAVGIQLTSPKDGAYVSTGNSIVKNYIGTNAGGDAILPNGEIGIEVNAARETQIGGAGSGNLISGNGGEGSSTRGGIVLAEQAVENRISGNRIGTNRDGSRSLYSQSIGVLVDGAENTIDNNQIGGNEIGLLLVGTRGTKVENNWIGTNIGGTFAVPNLTFGVVVTTNSSDNTIGGLTESDGDSVTRKGNVIGGNGRSGIGITAAGGEPAFGNRVQGNFIGVSPTGDSIPNIQSGITIFNAHNNLIGGSEAGRNVISSNGTYGILIYGPQAVSNEIKSNYIGTKADLALPSGNIDHGVAISAGANSNTVGGSPGEGNVIKFNGGSGVKILGGSSNTVANNTIATNLGDGIGLTQEALPAPEPEGSRARSMGFSSNGNRFFSNLIFGNSGLGIDVEPTGKTENDPGDSDEGPNRGQNYPEIVETSIDSNGDLLVRYKVDTEPGNASYGGSGLIVQFFKADRLGQGETYVGFDNYEIADYDTGQPGDTVINLGNAAQLGFAANDRLTATATDADNNTSEFSPVQFAPTAAGVTVTGRVLDSAGRGIRGVRVTATGGDGQPRSTTSNAFGNYSLDGLAAGQTYVVSVVHRRYRFAQSSMLVMLEDSLDGVNFIGTR